MARLVWFAEWLESRKGLCGRNNCERKEERAVDFWSPHSHSPLPLLTTHARPPHSHMAKDDGDAPVEGLEDAAPADGDADAVADAQAVRAVFG